MENKSLCSRCKGQCCKHVSGLYTHEQLPDWKGKLEADNKLEIVYLPIFSDSELKSHATAETDMPKELSELSTLAIRYMPKLKERLNTDGIVLLWGLRPSSKKPKRKYKIQFYKSTVGDKGCVHHGNKGCWLSYADRPQQCKNLEPLSINGEYVCGLPNNEANEETIKLFSTWENCFDEIQGYAVDMFCTDILTAMRADKVDISSSILYFALGQGLDVTETQGLSDFLMMLFEYNVNGARERFLDTIGIE